MRIAASVLALLVSFSTYADWKIAERSNPEGPGKAVDALENGRLVARLIYGEGQFKPYLHVFGESGELLTNPGLDKNGKTSGKYPHHRGIFIGWKIVSELGTDDLWHMTKGCAMELTKLETLTGAKDSARIVADIAWRSAKKTNGSDLLIQERRDLTISRKDKQTQVDAVFTLTPARDVRFAGDLQHSGVHFRAADEVSSREADTGYISFPDAKVKGSDLKWCHFVFPVGTNWYSAVQLNHPSNPVEELSMRKYGRFGYFFKKELKKGESLVLKYRFLVEYSRPALPSEPARSVDEEVGKLYAEYVKSR
jgi:methane monooxygenase PmoA-like